ncbi:hypothetical protein DPMN_100515 [Dreissena polymorpha]|uniref:Uncharacterized protein n=1 Tax=Dreissena polymorpha TaxID=45954 RepID=A0A9D4LHG5_DREPO|nr:hypothetical protein DPMN_100515 [Dreissena polymorpha]
MAAYVITYLATVLTIRVMLAGQWIIAAKNASMDTLERSANHNVVATRMLCATIPTAIVQTICVQMAGEMRIAVSHAHLGITGKTVPWTAIVNNAITSMARVPCIQNSVVEVSD